MEIRTSGKKVDWEGAQSSRKQAGSAGSGRKRRKNSLGKAARPHSPARAGNSSAVQGPSPTESARLPSSAVREPYCGKGVACQLVASLLAQLEGCIVTLYTHPRFLGLYEKLGFRRQKTGFVAFTKGASHAALMEREGFLSRKASGSKGRQGKFDSKNSLIDSETSAS